MEVGGGGIRVGQGLDRPAEFTIARRSGDGDDAPADDRENLP
jgi:hypothetical protein